MSQTFSLYRLQQSDSQIDRAEARLLVIQKILEDDRELSSAIENTEQSKVKFLSANAVLKQAEADTENQRIKLEQTEASLYSGKGHTPKELLDLENDVGALKRHLSTLENIQLEAMAAAEEISATYKQSQVELGVVNDNKEKQNVTLQEERNTLLKELLKLQAERSAVAGAIPPDIISRYDQLRQEKRGLAVVVISEGSCSACGSRLTAANIQSSRDSKSIALCPSCGRILYGS
jgi:hypothetical protein